MQRRAAISQTGRKKTPSSNARLQGELKSLLAEAMKILEEKERQVVALYYFEELTMKEVERLPGSVARVACFSASHACRGALAHKVAGTTASTKQGNRKHRKRGTIQTAENATNSRPGVRLVLIR